MVYQYHVNQNFDWVNIRTNYPFHHSNWSIVNNKIQVNEDSTVVILVPMYAALLKCSLKENPVIRIALLKGMVFTKEMIIDF